jgi:OOP family OmpA-OmpF porin
MTVGRTRRHLATGIAALVALGSCSGDDDSPPSLPEPSASSSTSVAPASTTGSTDQLTDAEFELWLRRKLTLPAMPAFTIPLDVFVDERDRELRDRLGLQPGLYEGIAVIDARCDAAGADIAADAGSSSSTSDGSGRFEDGAVAIAIDADGSGSYSDGTKSILVESDGSGSYESGSLSLVIESDGSGTYRDATREIRVDSDRTGSFRDEDIDVSVTELGGFAYQDGDGSIEQSQDGEVSSEGDDSHADVIARVLAEGLPLFPPVPHVGPVPAPAAGTSCGSVIRLDANVLFDFNADTLRPEAAALLDRVAALLVALGSPRLRVDGHTDSVGTDEYNLDLSARRAATVRQALIERGVTAGSIEARGSGESTPLVPNATPEGADDPAARQLNRRVELILLDGE